ncbi:MAG: YfcE family phosphodiesterase, partial [Candidatus Absconditabacterales bacterium]
MKIAVLSDTHENAHNLVVALEECQKLHVEKIFFLGDFNNNGVAKIFASSSIPVFAIWGNNDGDKAAIVKTSLAPGSNLEMGVDVFDIITLDGRNIFLTHYPMLAKPMAKSGDFDAVFYGHDHKHNMDTIGDCIIVNPGELGAHKFGKASFALYDTKTNEAELIFLDQYISLQ